MEEMVLDLSGLKCPVPALRTKRALAQMRAGQRLKVRCTDPLSSIDIPHLVHTLKHRLLSSQSDNGVLIFEIEKLGHTL